ncbi:AIPR family protein [Solwaraspora sp. WMMD1047]|uniref:AIPR family protein n=1 Tax=Solwaraspora sp. WMMD1047 TaxID=3016102 RepID=UPI002416CD94|nr:AIPR family protein [Solwaraspora sp. WMMD1047]MDG4829330.1 AIPR family protein [Solwaraspora sp. WMMD1047]
MQIRHVRDALKREFENIIDLDDLPKRSEVGREQAFLSRALAALVVRDLTGCDNAAAAGAVIDGRDDIGIDAVATDDSASHLWLIQSKWSDQGRASFGVAEALKFIDGLVQIDTRRFDRFNVKFQNLSDQVAAVLANPHSRITMVPALMRTDVLSDDVVRRLTDAQDEFNQLGTMLDHRIYLASDVWQVVRNDFSEPPIKLTAKMEDWIRITEPYEAFQGTISVAEVAQWYATHGDRLFDRNIRKPLGLTQVNQGLTDTLTSEPYNFWYFNNGITVLCDKLDPNYFSRSARSPVELNLDGASVVNGAQTVHAIYAASRKDTEGTAEGYVSVRVISLQNCQPGFADAVTTATNTQNRVERRDFVALDPTQAAIKEDFALSLQKTYMVKRGEPEPTPESGCSVLSAAIALACAHRNPELAIRAKRGTDLLWEEGPQGAYQLLFNEQDPPGAYQIWRTVLVLREIDETLHRTAKGHQARSEAIAERGNRLIAHIVFRYLDLDGIDDPDSDWSPILAQVPDATRRAAGWLVHHIDAKFGPNSIVASTLANVERCRALISLVLSDLQRNIPVPDLPPDYRPEKKIPKQRRPNAVPTLIDARRLADGTPLTYRAPTQPEREAMSGWLADDPRRGTATWVNQRVRPLLWAVDGKRYSPSGLVQQMWQLAGWSKAPVAAQGPSRWYVAGEGSLWRLALETMASLNDADEEEREV